MQPREIIVLFVVLLVIAFLGSSTYAWHDEIHKLQGQYANRGIKVPDASGKFRTTSPARNFDTWEIKDDDHDNFYYDADLQDRMDNVEDKVGNMELGSGYRSPDTNANTAGADPESGHQYSNCADTDRVNGKHYDPNDEAPHMTQADKDDFYAKCTAEGLSTTPKSDHIHISVSGKSYCDFP